MPPAADRAKRGSAVDIVVVRGCWWCKINDSGGKKGRQREREKGRGYGMGEGKRERLRARVCVCLEEVEKVQQRERGKKERCVRLVCACSFVCVLTTHKTISRLV